MTEMRTYAPAAAPTAQPWWKAVVVGLTVLVGLPASLVAGFAAAITWTGCFLSCSDPNPLLGFGLGVLALALLLAGPALAWVLYRRWAAVAYAALALPLTGLLGLAGLRG